MEHDGTARRVAPCFLFRWTKQSLAKEKDIVGLSERLSRLPLRKNVENQSSIGPSNDARGW
jgi:hypothetical protein